MADTALLRANAHKIRDALRAMQRHLGHTETFLDLLLTKVLANTEPEPPTPAALAQLSPRQREVLCLCCDGIGNKGMARQLGVSEYTVKVHLAALYKKLGISNRTQAAAWSARYLDSDITKDMLRLSQQPKPILTRRDVAEINKLARSQP